MIKTIVINLFGAPGCGKSTTASKIFYELKKIHLDVELVSEYAKELVWEERYETMKDEIYIFGKQQHKFQRLKDKVKFIVTDRPIALSKFYNEKYGKPSLAFNTLIDEVISEFDNWDIFLKRGNFEYKSEGRVQSDEDSLTFEKEMLEFYDGIFQIITDDEDQILDHIMNKIKN